MDNKLGMRGEVTIEKLHLDTYEVYETSTPECNDINWQVFANCLIYTGTPTLTVPIKTPSSGTISSPWQIAWSQHNIDQDITNLTIPTGVNNSVTFGDYVNVNVGTPYFTPKVLISEKDYVTFVADILPDTTTRTIKSLGLANKYNAGATNLSFAIDNRTVTNLNLTAPCTQDTSTVVRVTYRLYLDDFVPSVTTSNISDGYFYVLRNMLKEMSDGTYTGITPISIRHFNGVLVSSFYDHDNITNLKSVYANGSASQNLKYSDQSISEINMVTGFASYDGSVYSYTNSYALGHLPTMGTFFRTLNLTQIQSNNITDTSGGNATYNTDTPFLYQRAIPTSYSPIKNVFKQISTAPGPFQDISYISAMSGTLTLNSSAWAAKPFPKLVRLIMTSDGTSTTSTYKFETLDFAGGFIENTFCPREVNLPQDGLTSTLETYHRKDPNEQVIIEYVGLGGTTVRSVDDTYKFVAVNCQRTKNAISIYDISTGDKQTLSSTTTPSLPVANTSDVAVSNGYIFVTCSTTGLWQIDPTLTSVTHLTSIGGSIDSSKAYQIDVKANGDLWVLFEGGLAKGVTSNSGATWSWTVYDTTSSPAFNATGITNSNWANVSSMVIDKDHANNRILFVTGTGATANSNASSFIWWEGSTGTTTIQTTGLAYPSFSLTNNLKRSDLMKCSNGYWFSNLSSEFDSTTTIYKTTFASLSWTTNVLSTGTASSGRVTPVTLAGIPGIFIGSSSVAGASQCSKTPAFFVRNTNISALPASIVSTTPQIEFFTKFGALDTTTTNMSIYFGVSLVNNGHTPIAYLPTSNMMVYFNTNHNNFAICPLVIDPSVTNYASFKSVCWKSYGWDGSAWAIGNTNSKTCHNTPSELIDGITVQFNDGGSAPHFVNTNQFMFVIGDGIMKDNATAYSLRYTYYPLQTERVSSFYTQTAGQVTTVPNYRYGYMTDEIVNFSSYVPNTGGNFGVLQSRGRITGCEAIAGNFRVSDQLIPANTPFTFKFKLITTAPGNGGDTGKRIVVYFYNGTYNVQYYLARNSVGDYCIHNSSNTILATVPFASLNINTDFTIERGNNNRICFYYGTSLIYAPSATLSVELTIGADMQYNSNTYSTMGYYDMRLSYHELRRMVKIGNASTFTGHFNPKFARTTNTTIANDSAFTINNIARTVVNKTASEAISGLEVKVGTSCGYLVFGNLPAITFTATGSPTAGPSLAPVVSGGIITGIDIIATGSGFATTPTITIEAPPSGVTATATIALTASRSVNDLITITTAGTGYTDGDYALIFTGGGGSGATGVVTIKGGSVLKVNITNGGSGYTSTPTLSFTGAGSPSVAAVLTAAIGFRIASVTVTNGGSGYIPDGGTSLVGYATAHYLP